MAEILVVDNNKCICDLLADVLAADGHRVRCAQTGANAIDLLDQAAFDIAFVDLSLPDIDGFQVLRHISENAASTRAVVISGRSDFDTAVKSFRAGATDYLLKPFDIQEVLQIARNQGVSVRAASKHVATSTDFAAESPAGSLRWNRCLLVELVSVLAGFVLGSVGVKEVFRLSEAVVLNAHRIALLTISLGCCWGSVLFAARRLTASRSGPAFLPSAIRVAAAYSVFSLVSYFVIPSLRLQSAIGLGLVLSVLFVLAGEHLMGSKADVSRPSHFATDRRLTIKLRPQVANDLKEGAYQEAKVPPRLTPAGKASSPESVDIPAKKEYLSPALRP